MKWYKYDIREMSLADYQKWYGLMNQSKRARVDCFHFADDRKRTVAGEMLARKAIAQWCDVPAESIAFELTEAGKPYAKDMAVEFNISHCGDMVICAVDNKPVGVDIERIRPIHLKIAKRICTEEELTYLFGHRPTEEDFVYTTDYEKLVRFFELWTDKEALCKQKGVGISELYSALEKRTVQTENIIDGEYMICIAV